LRVTGSRNMASGIGQTISSDRRFVTVVQFLLCFICYAYGTCFSNVQCQMLNVGRTLTDVIY